MEQLQVHSKSYIVRWVDVTSGHTISWSLQPNKKSLNFGIFKHPGPKGGLSPNLPTSAVFDPDAAPPPTPTVEQHDGSRKRGSVSKHQPTNVVEKLESIGLKCVEWTGKCEADKVAMGRYDIPEGGSGMYGLVLDNTFSKTVSKTATFVLMTHPTSAPPKSASLMRYNQEDTASVTSSTHKTPPLDAVSEFSESQTQGTSNTIPILNVPKQTRSEMNIHTGTMYKKRRKRNQGWGRRYFSLDFTSSTLSYYRNNHSSALRGAVPLSLAAIGVDEKHREFSIDSGAEVWHLRLRNKKDFDTWRTALEVASSSPVALPSPAIVMSPGVSQATPFIDRAGEHEWARVEELVGRVSGSRDAVRRLAQDTDPKYGAAANGHGPNDSPASNMEENSYFMEAEGRSADRLPFWKRKPSSSSQGGSPSGLFRRSVSAQLAAPSPPMAAALSPQMPTVRRKASILSQGPSDDIHERCMALLRDLDTTVAEFSSLLAESKLRRRPPLPQSTSRMSLDSVDNEDYFDAEDSLDPTQSQMLRIQHEDDASEEKDNFVSDDDDSESNSDAGDRAPSVAPPRAASVPGASLYPARPTSLLPKQVPFIHGRSIIAPPKQPPPSIIGFLRKNAGKDLSTVSMPVTANEPTSLLQRFAEPLESASLLSVAASKAEAFERLIYVAAFAVSSFSSNRVKERAVRKPFNPMLGETFELVRRETPSSSSPSYRFLAEKVSHHPVIMAWQADSLNGAWSISQTPQPAQKFWGKSVELNTEGRWRLILHLPTESGNGTTEERYTWSQATCFLRNVIAGEKYVEPVQSMTITNETTGHKAVATFKAAGMFSGRSEDVTVNFYDPGSTSALPTMLTGKWPTGLTRSDTGTTIWEPGPLVADAAKVYGFPVFTAGLNEVTEVEEGKIAPTDSRLRPDQKALEEGNLDKAEALKARLEERQRARRKVLEAHGQAYKSVFFEAVGDDGGAEGGEKTWRLKTGRDGYWECRERGEWKIEEVFEV